MSDMSVFGQNMGVIERAGQNTLNNIQTIQQNTGLQQQNQIRAKAMQQQDQQQQQLQQFNQDWSAARGDPQKLNDLVYKYPSMISTLKERIGLQDDMQATQAGQLANGVRVAMSQGPQQVQQFIQQNAGAFQALNIDPQDAWEQYQTDQQGFEQAVHAVQLSSMGTKDQLDYANEVERNRLTARSQDIQAANLAMNRQFNFLRYQGQQAKQQAELAKSERERTAAQQKQAQVYGDTVDTQRDWLNGYNSQVTTLDNAIGQVNRLIPDNQKNPASKQRLQTAWEGASGLSGTIARNIPGANDEKQLVQDLKSLQGLAMSQSMAALKAASGTAAGMSEKESMAITQSLMGFDPENIQDPAAAQRAIKNFGNYLKRLRDGYEKANGGRVKEYTNNTSRYDAVMNDPKLDELGVPAQARKMLLSDPSEENKRAFKEWAGYLPEGL
ncbi:released from the phage upon host infection [Escherichia phage C130_2]|uniref:DNA transfer protein n=1 Tax=Escherichia phage C130_2 TaxID=2234093 RepID=A0A384ZRS4_9CAUD|nr:released from the phage upon host infection [Escherichia phage C130_2]AXC34343.1 DNA transfer protein [Escherichia phage C130_2]